MLEYKCIDHFNSANQIQDYWVLQQATTVIGFVPLLCRMPTQSPLY